MSNDVTTATLWSRGLDLADMTGSAFPDTARTLDILNEGLSELHELLVETHEDYLTKESSEISIVAGTESYSLPTDFLKAVQVFLHTNGRRYKMEAYQLVDLDGFKTAPISAGSVKMFYVPQLTLFTDASTNKVSDKIATCPIGWERLIAYHVAWVLLQREESFEAADRIFQAKEAEKRRIREHAEMRDYEGGEVSDAYGRWACAGLEADRIQGRFRYRIMADKIYFTQVEPYGIL